MGNQVSDILDELRKTGYPTEIIASSVLRNRGWAVVHNPTYMDDVENRSREFDVQAGRILDGGPINLGIFLLIECKKSEKPWVFFTTERDPEAPGIETCINTTSGPLNLLADFQGRPALFSPSLLREEHHYQTPQRLARTFYEPFKGKERDERSPMIYAAALSAIKAVLFHANRNASTSTWAGVYYPIIVFCGTMYEAIVNSSTDIELAEVEHLLMSFRYFPPRSATRRDSDEFLIDVVRDTHLDAYLGVVENEHTRMYQDVLSHNRQPLGRLDTLPR